MGKVANAKRKAFFEELKQPRERKPRKTGTSHSGYRGGTVQQRREFTRRLHEQRLGREPDPVEYTPATSANGQDAVVVRTDMLAHEINRWLRIEGNNLQLLARLSGTTDRQLSRIRRGLTEHTGLNFADRLLMAMGVEHLLRAEPRMVTRDDVAQRAHVDPATVTRVTSGKRNVLPSTKDHIEKVAEELRYTPGDRRARLADMTPRPNPAWSQERWFEWKRQQGCI